MASTEKIGAFLAEGRNVIVAGIRRDGRPHLSPNSFYWYYSRGFALSCCLRPLGSGRFPIRCYDERRPLQRTQPGGRELQPCDLGRPWRVGWFVEQDEDDTAALASIGDVADCTARADTQVRAVLRPSAYRMLGSCGRVRPAISAQKFLSSFMVVPCHGAVFLGSEKNRRNLCPSNAC
jgi:hypothetical protein